MPTLRREDPRSRPDLGAPSPTRRGRDADQPPSGFQLLAHNERAEHVLTSSNGRKGCLLGPPVKRGAPGAVWRNDLPLTIWLLGRLRTPASTDSPMARSIRLERSYGCNL